MSAEIPEELQPEIEQFKAQLQSLVTENMQLKRDAPRHFINGFRAAIDTFRPIIKPEN